MVDLFVYELRFHEVIILTNPKAIISARIKRSESTPMLSLATEKCENYTEVSILAFQKHCR